MGGWAAQRGSAKLPGGWGLAAGGESKTAFPTGIWSFAIIRNNPGKHQKKKKTKEPLVAALDQIVPNAPEHS